MKNEVKDLLKNAESGDVFLTNEGKKVILMGMGNYRQKDVYIFVQEHNQELSTNRTMICDMNGAVLNCKDISIVELLHKVKNGDNQNVEFGDRFKSEQLNTNIYFFAKRRCLYEFVYVDNEGAIKTCAITPDRQLIKLQA